MKKQTQAPTQAAIRVRDALIGVEQPDLFYGPEGLAALIDRESKLPAIKAAFADLLNYIGGHDERDPKHPIVRAHAALKLL